MWASIVKQAAAPSASGSAQLTSSEGLKIVVVDANAVINGIRLEGIADKAVTLQDVLDEVRDKQSRQFLASLAIKLEVSEPSEESLKAGAPLPGSRAGC
jgi:RNA-binding protein NOB1